MSHIESQSSHDAFEEEYQDKPESRLLGDTKFRHHNRDKRSLVFWGVLSMILPGYSLILFIVGYYTGSLSSLRRMSNCRFTI